jgi:hypothetical protein
MSDYLPAPYNLTNFAPPVEQLLPNVTPFLTLADGRTIVAANGADEIEPSPDGASVHATWRRWSVIGEKLGQTVEPGLVADIYWRLNGTSLERKEVLSSTSAISIRRFWVVVPSTATEVSAASQDGRVSYQFHSPVGTLLVGTTTSGPPLKAMLRATGNGTLGRGSRGPVPLLLEFEARNLTVDPKEPMSWTLTMTLKGEDKTPSAGN